MGMKWEDVWKSGPCCVRTFKIETGKASTGLSPPPKALFVAVPTEDGDYPLLIFLHGFLMHNVFYCNILKHVASHGYMVIAPQIDTPIWQVDATEDVVHAAEITDWLDGGLRCYLDGEGLEKVRPDFRKVALAGHSRGGKVAFALALGRVPNTTTSLKFSALIGLDPVDGLAFGIQTEPRVLTGQPDTFDLGIPVLVVGSGLGSQSIRSCVPKGLNHVNFFDECRAPAYYFVASNYGHMDFLDDNIPYWARLVSGACKSGGEKEPLRKFAGGILVAFLKSSLRADPTALDDIFDYPSLALLVNLDPPKSKVAEPSDLDEQSSEI